MSNMVPCRTLESIFDEANVSWVDFFSLDVERAEAIVLSSINFSKVQFGVILVENMWHDEAVDRILIDKAGMVKLNTNGTGVASCRPSSQLSKR
jgi:hypothetical protein